MGLSDRVFCFNYHYSGGRIMETSKLKQDYSNMFNRLQKQEGQDKPPASWDAFLREATDVFIRKDTDYDSRFMRGMLELDARTLWAWEVDKKLDRIRTWLKRGELQVKGEGLNNAVSDLFVYTVQYKALKEGRIHLTTAGPLTLLDYWKRGRKDIFYVTTAMVDPKYWVDYLEAQGRIKADELALKNIIRLYMGGAPTVEEWKAAARSFL
jgi:hypothetical protein